MSIEQLFKLDNIIYLIVMVVVVVLTTIKQFKSQQKKNDSNNAEVLQNLSKIEKQNGKMLNLLEIHSQDIKSMKKDINVLEHRVSRLEDSHVNLYEKLGGKKNDNI